MAMRGRQSEVNGLGRANRPKVSGVGVEQSSEKNQLAGLA